MERSLEMTNGKPKLAIVSDLIRSDLQEPFVYFEKFDVYHFYNRLEHKDLDVQSYPNLVYYKNPKDLYDKLVEIRPDIIQGPEPYATRKGLFNTLSVVLASRKLHKPFYFPMIENRPPKEKFGLAAGILLEKYLAWYSLKAKRIIHLNKGAKKNLLDVGISENKIDPTRWACWVDVKKFAPSGEKKIGKEPILLYVGRLIYQKGIDDVLEAYRLLYKEYPNMRLILIGPGDYQDKIREFKAQHGLDKLELLGFQPNNELPKYFNQAFLTISPSITVPKWEEQVGLVNLQSLACGTPVISTKSGGIPEYVMDGQTGILVDEHSPKQIVQAVKELYTDQARYLKMAKEARQYSEEYFDAPGCVHELENYLLEKVL